MPQRGKEPTRRTLGEKISFHTSLEWPGWHTIAIWVIVLGMMTSFTIRDLLPLLSEYTDNNMSTEMAIVTNDAFPRPNVTMCMTHYSSSLLTVAKAIAGNQSCTECDELRDRGWDVWRDAESDASASRLAEIILKRLFHEESDEGFPSLILNRTNFNWNQPLLDSVSYLLCYYGLLDRGNTVGYYHEIDAFPLCQGFDPDHVGLEINDKSLDELYRLYMDGIDVYLRDFIYQDDETEEVSGPSLRTRNPYIYGDYFCVPMLASYGGETFLWKSFSNDTTNDPPWKRSPRRSNLLAKDDTIMYASILSTDLMYVTDPRMKLDEIHYENAGLNWEVRTRVIDERPRRTCSPEPVVARCFISKQLNATLEYCGCVPFTYRHMVSMETVPYCNHIHYNTCHSRLEESINIHRAKCDDVCEYVIYEWQRILTAGDIPEYANETRDIRFELLLVESTKRYVEFRINLKTTPEMFISQIGGVINFYLGFDGLTVCAILIFLTDMMKRYRSRKTEATMVQPMATAGEAGDAEEQHRDPRVESDRVESITRRLDDVSADMREMKAALASINTAMQMMKNKLQEHDHLLAQFEERLMGKTGEGR